jgi:3'(2'), 5'-bisphosphate nucleotidase
VTTDSRLAAALAKEAGQLLLGIRSAGTGGDAKELGRQGDRESNSLLLSRLSVQRPTDAILSEESADDPARLEAERVWIIDPLDGTREFTMPGRQDWAVHVALWQAAGDGGVTDAAVALPALGEVFGTDPATSPAPSDPGRRLRVLVSDTRPPAFAEPVAAEIGAEVVPMGSAGAKTMAVVRHDADAYVHAGGQWEWDSAAPVGVAVAAGLHASRIDGSPLVYNQPHPYLPDLLVCRAELAGPLLEALERFGSAPAIS